MNLGWNAPLPLAIFLTVMSVFMIVMVIVVGVKLFREYRKD